MTAGERLRWMQRRGLAPLPPQQPLVGEGARMRLCGPADGPHHYNGNGCGSGVDGGYGCREPPGDGDGGGIDHSLLHSDGCGDGFFGDYGYSDGDGFGDGYGDHHGDGVEADIDL